MGVLVPPVESHALVYDVFPHMEEVVELPEYAGLISAVFLRGVYRGENRLHLFPYAVEESASLL